MSGSNSIVKTNYGQVKGQIKKTELGKEYFSFQNIPYVKQPIGELRFKDPQPIEPWSDVLDATKEGPPCYNFDIFRPNGPELCGGDNCLGLNVFTPNLKPSKPLPVFVWIHGGGFVNGSSSTMMYGPDYLVEKDVLVVSINYRLNIFGFLSFKDPKVGVPGNAGLKDQSMALKWIKENVAHFGGDSNNITIAGESAGGASIHYHLISDMSKGLFNKAIPMSGVSLNPWALAPKKYDEYVTKFTIALGLKGDEDDMTKFKAISQCDSAKLVQIDMTLLTPDEKLSGDVLMSCFVPRVEPYVTKMCFMPKSPLEMGRNAWSKDIDIIFGGCSDEGLLFYLFAPTAEQFTVMNKDYRCLLPVEVRGQANANEMGKKLKELYFGKSDLSLQNLDKLMEYHDEKFFWHGIHRAILQRQISDGKGKTYLYYLNVPASTDVPEFYKLGRTLANVPHMNGTCHADDIPLIFKADFGRRYMPGHDNYEVHQKFLDMFVQFFKTGNPSNALIKSANWEPIPKGRSDDLKCLKICRDKVIFTDLPKTDKIKVWNSLFEKDLL